MKSRTSLDNDVGMRVILLADCAGRLAFSYRNVDFQPGLGKIGQDKTCQMKDAKRDPAEVMVEEAAAATAVVAGEVMEEVEAEEEATVAEEDSEAAGATEDSNEIGALFQ